MISRRNIIRGAAATAVAAPAAGLLVNQAMAGGSSSTGTKADGLTLNIVNKSGQFKAGSIYVYIVGSAGDKQVHVTKDGEAKPVEAGDNGGDGYTDYAIPLDGSETKLKLPEMSGRIYFALGDKLKFKVNSGDDGKAALAYPAAWTESDPNYQVLHDCVEFTYKDGSMYCNTTMVDMFSVPLSIQLKGDKDQTTGELKEGARDKAFKEVAGKDGFDKLIVDDKRIIAPGHGLGEGKFSKSYFDPYIDKVWSQYEGKDLTITTNAGKFTGRVKGDDFSFSGPGDASFKKPTTKDVLFCDGNLAAPNDGTTGPVAAILGAALNRSTLLSSASQPGTEAGDFYKEDITNHYSAAMHAATKDGKAYGFAFDDVASFASYIEDGKATELTVTLTPF